MNSKLIAAVCAALISTSVLAAEEAAPATPEATAETTTGSAATANTATATEGSVTRAAITSAIQDREPADKVKQISASQERVYYFTELRDMQGQTAIHRWEHKGEVKAEVSFNVGGPRWRVYSSKTLDPSWTGEWKASVIDSSGNTLAVNTFNVTEAAAETGTATEKTKEAAPSEGAATTQKP